MSESIVYGRPGQSLVFNYANPFGLYYFSEINEQQGGANTNKMVGVDGAWRSSIGNFSFEWYLDDISAFGGCGAAAPDVCKKPPSGGWTLQLDGIPFLHAGIEPLVSYVRTTVDGLHVVWHQPGPGVHRLR